MTRPKTYDERSAHRVRKAVSPILRDFGAALEAGTALEAAVTDAANAMIRKAVADALAAGQIDAGTAARLAASPPPPTPAPDVLKGGGTTWQQIQRGAAALAGTTPERLTPTAMARAVDELLRTPEGARLYDQYLAETDRAAAAQARQRRDDGR